MRIHELKTWPSFFEAVEQREKTFEVRKNDRDFSVGDLLILRCWDPASEKYRPKHLVVVVTHVLHGGNWGVESGHVVMAIRQASAEEYRLARCENLDIDPIENAWRWS